MKLTITTDNPEILVSGLSQAITGYGQTLNAIMFGCNIPGYMENHFEKLGLERYEDQEAYCKERLLEMKTMYDQLIVQVDAKQTKP